MSEPDCKTTRLSEWEVRVHGSGALRVMGVPFGLAESAARVLWWNQAMQVPAIEWLMANEEAVRLATASTLRLVDNADQSITVDAGGQSILTAGFAAFDVACAEGRTGLPSTVHLVNTTGVELANYFPALGRQREINSAVRTEPATVTFRVGGDSASSTEEAAFLEDAFRRGVEVESTAAAKFLDRGHQLWVPTSERSRSQGSSITDLSPQHAMEQR